MLKKITDSTIQFDLELIKGQFPSNIHLSHNLIPRFVNFIVEFRIQN